MHFALIADTFPPLRSSGAIQLRDLSREFVRQGHQLTLFLPSSGQAIPWALEDYEGVKVLRLKAPRMKDVGYVRRTLAEIFMPFFMRYNLRHSPLSEVIFDGVLWYSPSIFHGYLAKALKKSSRCRGYLILRDIFPEWAVDLGLMSRGLPYRFFDAVARYQYSIADVIGVQSPGNRQYFDRVCIKSNQRLEVLQNWLGDPIDMQCSIKIEHTALKGRKILVYAGNMGVAQGMDILLDLAEELRDRKDIGFLMVGRGSDGPRLKLSAQDRQLDNVLFFDEIEPEEIPGLYAQCDVGVVALDPRHKSHNIPGKFLAYMQSGLPVLANVNKGNDLAEMIRIERVGEVCESNEVGDLLASAEKLLNDIQLNKDMSARCKALFESNFAVENAVKQIVATFS